MARACALRRGCAGCGACTPVAHRTALVPLSGLLDCRVYPVSSVMRLAACHMDMGIDMVL